MCANLAERRCRNERGRSGAFWSAEPEEKRAAVRALVHRRQSDWNEEGSDRGLRRSLSGVFSGIVDSSQGIVQTCIQGHTWPEKRVSQACTAASHGKGLPPETRA